MLQNHYGIMSPCHRQSFQLFFHLIQVPGMASKRRNQAARRGAGVMLSVVEAAEAGDDPDGEEDDGGGGGSPGGDDVGRRATVEFELTERTRMEGEEEEEERLSLEMASSKERLRHYLQDSRDGESGEMNSSTAVASVAKEESGRGEPPGDKSSRASPPAAVAV